MRAAILALLLAGCAIAPEGTSLVRMMRSLHHVDHPDYVLAARQEFVELSGVGEAQWLRDADD